MAKKDFKAQAAAQLDPIAQFISSAETVEEPSKNEKKAVEEISREEKPAADQRSAPKRTTKKKSQGGSIEHVIQAQLAKEELKSKKAQVLFKPSTYEGLKAAAADMGTSVNNLINVLAEEFLKNR